MRRVDLVGQKFSRLFVLEPTHVKNGHQFWKCLCDCGNFTYVSTGNLHNGNVTSCGCYRKERQSLKRGQAMFNRVYLVYQSNARIRQIKFNLSKEKVYELTQMNCFYCGSSPSNVSKRNLMNGEFVYNGIDRLNPSVGYVDDNVVPCCFECNRAKNNMSYNDFMAWISRLLKHQMSKKSDVVRV